MESYEANLGAVQKGTASHIQNVRKMRQMQSGKLVGQGVMGARDKSGWEKELKARLEAVHTAAQEKDAAAIPESTEDSSDAAAQ